MLTLVADSTGVVEKKKPGEYVMQLVMLNFVQLTSKKFEQIINGDKKVRTVNFFSSTLIFNLFGCIKKGKTIKRLFSKE